MSGQLIKILFTVVGLATEMFKYLNSKREDKKKIEDEKRQKKVDQCIDDVVDNGSIKDLIDIGNHIK